MIAAKCKKKKLSKKRIIIFGEISIIIYLQREFIIINKAKKVIEILIWFTKSV